MPAIAAFLQHLRYRSSEREAVEFLVINRIEIKADESESWEYRWQGGHCRTMQLLLADQDVLQERRLSRRRQSRRGPDGQCVNIHVVLAGLCVE